MLSCSVINEKIQRPLSLVYSLWLSYIQEVCWDGLGMWGRGIGVRGVCRNGRGGWEGVYFTLVLRKWIYSHNCLQPSRWTYLKKYQKTACSLFNEAQGVHSEWFSAQKVKAKGILGTINYPQIWAASSSLQLLTFQELDY